MTTTKYKTNKEIIPPIETNVESSWFCIKSKIRFEKLLSFYISFWIWAYSMIWTLKHRMFQTFLLNETEKTNIKITFFVNFSRS